MFLKRSKLVLKKFNRDKQKIQQVIERSTVNKKSKELSKIFNTTQIGSQNSLSFHGLNHNIDEAIEPPKNSNGKNGLKKDISIDKILATGQNPQAKRPTTPNEKIKSCLTLNSTSPSKQAATVEECTSMKIQKNYLPTNPSERILGTSNLLRSK